MSNSLEDADLQRRRLEGLLVQPRESLDVELKQWLDLSAAPDKANLAHAMLALANHGGGYVVIGFQEIEGGHAADSTNRPASLKGIDQDAVNSIVLKYAEPAFHCDVHHIAHPDTGEVFPIVVVPAGTVPIRAKSQDHDGKHIKVDTYYIRRPGPQSSPPISGAEWDVLLTRCLRAKRDDLFQAFRDVFYGLSSPGRPEPQVEEASRALDVWQSESIARFTELLKERLPDEDPSRFAPGYWTVSYLLEGNLLKPDARTLLEKLQLAQGTESGWPPWLVFTSSETGPYIYKGILECWLAETRNMDASSSDFWRVAPDGKAFVLRGYDDDSKRRNVAPGSIFDIGIPVWRVGECLRHAARLAVLLQDPSAVASFQFTWTGLKGRYLSSWADVRRSLAVNSYQSRQSEVVSYISVPVSQIEDALPETVEEVMKPLYEAFNFLHPIMPMIRQELGKMLNRLPR